MSKSKVTSSFWGIWYGLYFLAAFYFSLLLPIGKRSTLAKIRGGGCSPLVSPDFTGLRLDLLMKANKYIKDMSNVEFAYSDTNCRLKVRFKNRVEESFDSMEDLISKVICLEG